jgi:hypothetical protein
MMPEDDWNHRTPRDQDYWPLFTLWADPDNWIEFGARAWLEVSGETRTDKGSFRVRIMEDGTLHDPPFDWPRNPDDGTFEPDIYWSRDSQFLVGLSYNATTHRLTVLASLGGDAPRRGGRTMDLPIIEFSSGYEFDTLKFRGADDEVVTCRWFGGQAIHGTAMAVGDMETQFKTLEFLT